MKLTKINKTISTLLSTIFLFSIITGCSKDADTTPGNIATEVIDTTSLKTFNIKYELPQQIVNTKVENNTLTLIFNEKVNLLVETTEYERSWSLRLTEDFSKSSLAALSFYTIAADGTRINNWADNNLNNNPKIIKSKTDTTISGKRYLKIRIERDFIFSKEYPDAELAAAARYSLLNKTEPIGFSAYYYSDDKTIPAVVSAAPIVYK